MPETCLEFPSFANLNAGIRFGKLKPTCDRRFVPDDKHGKMGDALELVAVTSGGKVGGGVSERYQTREDLERALSQVGGTATNPILRPGQFTVGLGTGFAESSDTIYGLYVQDTWRLKPTLTLNYGLRYDYENGAFRGGTIRNSSLKGGCLQGNGLIPACSSDNNNFQPRLGIAWNPNFENGALYTLFGDHGESVIRASGGVLTSLPSVERTRS